MKQEIREGISLGNDVAALLGHMVPMIAALPASRARVIGVLLAQLAVVLIWGGHQWLAARES